MGNRSSAESSGQVAPEVDVEAGQGLSSSGWGSWMRLPMMTSQEEAVEEAAEPCQCLDLTFTQRVWGFATCFALGMVISIMSTFLVANPVKFALPYSVGNVLSLLSTGFLVGPKRQLRYACDPTRVWAFVIYVGCIVCTIVSALVFRKGALTLLFVIVQFFAGLWYTASYVPYGRDLLTRLGNTCLGQASAQLNG